MAEKVRVYRNLGRVHPERYSIQTYTPGIGWRVADHQDHVALTDVEFKVYEASRKRVLRAKSKNVHAYAVGMLVRNLQGFVGKGYDTVRYNPYTCDCFETTTGTRADRAERVLLGPNGVLATGVS